MSFRVEIYPSNLHMHIKITARAFVHAHAVIAEIYNAYKTALFFGFFFLIITCIIALIIAYLLRNVLLGLRVLCVIWDFA